MHETQQNKPKIGIILVNYNGYADTAECLKSLEAVTYSNQKIYVVDNASTIEPEK